MYIYIYTAANRYITCHKEGCSLSNPAGPAAMRSKQYEAAYILVRNPRPISHEASFYHCLGNLHKMD